MKWVGLSKMRMSNKTHIQTLIAARSSLMTNQIRLHDKLLLRQQQPQLELRLHSKDQRGIRIIILLTKAVHSSYHRLMLLQHRAAHRKHQMNTLNWRMIIKVKELRKDQIDRRLQFSTSWCILSCQRIAWSQASSLRHGTQRWVRFNSYSTEASRQS